MTDNMQRARERISDVVLEVLACEPCIGTCESEESFAHRIAIAAALRLAAPEWRPIETAPKDGTPHVRGLWVTTKREGRPDEQEWRYYAGYIDVYGHFVDSEYAESFGWEADWYDAWAPLPAAPTVSAEGESDA